MSTTVDQAFIRQYEREVHHAYQRQGSLLRGLCRTKNGIVGSSTTFQVIGKGTMGGKARHGVVPISNASHTSVQCNLVDQYAGDWVDNLDELKTNIDERDAMAKSQAFAAGRRTDQFITDALTAVSGNTGSVTMTSGATIRNSVLERIQAMQDRDVPFDGRVFAAISPRTETALLTVPEFSDADYVGPDLPFMKAMGVKIRTWLKVNWICFTGLPKSGNTRTNFFWHYDAVGHAIGSDIKTDISWHGDRAAHFFLTMLSMGAVIIDNDGVESMTIDESTALPTT